MSKIKEIAAALLSQSKETGTQVQISYLDLTGRECAALQAVLKGMARRGEIELTIGETRWQTHRPAGGYKTHYRWDIVAIKAT